MTPSYRVTQRTHHGRRFWCVDRLTQREHRRGVDRHTAWLTGDWYAALHLARDLTRGARYPGLQWLTPDQAPSPTVHARRAAHQACASITRSHYAS